MIFVKRYVNGKEILFIKTEEINKKDSKKSNTYKRK